MGEAKLALSQLVIITKGQIAKHKCSRELAQEVGVLSKMLSGGRLDTEGRENLE